MHHPASATTALLCVESLVSTAHAPAWFIADCLRGLRRGLAVLACEAEMDQPTVARQGAAEWNHAQPSHEKCLPCEITYVWLVLASTALEKAALG
jgi:hypothetical protein